MPDFVWRWCIAWLDHKGLAAVAEVLELRAAKLGDVNAMYAAAKRAINRADHAGALLAIAPALAKTPENPAFWCIRGVAHRMAMSFDAARSDYEHALTLKPGYVVALSNLGEWHLARVAFDEALTWINAALAIDPSYFEARVNRVAVLIELGRLTQAREQADQLVASDPLRPESYGNLGNVFLTEGKWKEAVEQYKKALELRPDYAEAHFNLATLFGSSGSQELAIDYLERQIEEKGETNNRMSLLAAALKEAGHLEKAEALCRKTLARYPNSLRAPVVLSGCLSDSGQSAQALEVLEQILLADPSQLDMQSNILFELNCLPSLSREEVFRRHRAWAQQFEEAHSKPRFVGERNRHPQRRLKIGYVSGDFCSHPVGLLLREVVRQHDKENFEIHCFSVQMRADDVTAEIQAATDGWEDAVFLSAEELATAIDRAQIDVLIDLSGHTALHRLTTFAKRPAPIQASWIGYFHSTGLSSMDYFITDPHTSPRDGGQLFSERAVHLPHTRFCFTATNYTAGVAPSPVTQSGVVTFGSFNRLSKLNNPVIAAWARILLAVPGSRLILKTAALRDDSVCHRLSDRFVALGVDAARLDLRGSSAHRDMLQEYGDIDIALDPFPFNGGMTTLEALWMGVPVVTLAGNTVVSRQTYSALANIGLADALAFPNVDAYVAGAVALANDTARLTALRAQIRPRMQASPLCQPELFTRDLEALYRRMWQAWCKGEHLPADVLQLPDNGN